MPVLYEGEPGDVGYLVSKDDGARLTPISAQEVRGNFQANS